MASNLFFTAAAITFCIVVAVMLPYFGKIRDVSDMTPEIASRLAKRIFPLMFVFGVFAFLGSQANSWGWP
ncbi:hypothetical protein [Rhizobium gallicum]|nr:hypothetical protein [Rhizobium gallicum]